nr:Unknown Function [uncultured bacterium]
MNDDILFEEKQQFKQIWLWVLLLGINCIFLYGVFKQVIVGQRFGNHPLSNMSILVVTFLTLLLTLLFVFLRLETQIRMDGVYVRFFPFHVKFKKYYWSVISQSFVRKYSPIREYGGWGVRWSPFGKGRAYNVSGNMGIQIVFNSGSALLIGTRKEEEVKKVLIQIGHLSGG